MMRIEINESKHSIPQDWFDLNYRLQDEALHVNINKNFIEKWIFRLTAMIHPRSHCFWLFLARINELALFCAAGYVDGCELDAANEFLAERDSLVHLPTPRCKGNEKEGDSAQKGNKGALITYLVELLEGSGFLSREYLHSVHSRIERMKDVINIYHDQGIGDSDLLFKTLSCMPQEKRKGFRSMLCGFDKKVFNDMGRELHQLMRYGAIDSRYMANPLKDSFIVICHETGTLSN